MKAKVFWILIATSLIVAVSYFPACQGGKYEVVTSASGPTTGITGSIQGFVRDFQTKTEVQDATVELLDDITGEPLLNPKDGKPFTLVTGADGSAEFSGVPATTVGVKVTKENATDTVEFHFEVGIDGEEFLLVSNATKTLIALGLGVTLDPTKGFAAGGVYYGDALNRTHQENHLGCAEVSIMPDDGQLIYYFGSDALPTLAREITGTSPATGQGTNPGVDSKDHPISYYASLNREINHFNATVAKSDAKAAADDTTGDDTADDDLADDDTGVPASGNTSPLWIVARIYSVEGSGTSANSVYAAGIMPRLYPNTVTISNVYFTFAQYPANPTPEWCTF